jgi:hypothetical protein
VSSEISDLSEALGDVPAFESEKGLLSWLDVGKKKLQKILESRKQAQVKDKSRGSYYKTRIGAALAPRTERLIKAGEKKNREAHGSGLTSWLKGGTHRGQATVDMGREMSQGAGSMQINDQTIADAAIATLPCLTMDLEEIESGRWTSCSQSPTPSELSRLEEDRLGDFEEIFVSVSAATERSPDPPTTLPAVSSAVLLAPMPNAADASVPHPPVRFSPPLFSRADDIFQPVETVPRGTPPARNKSTPPRHSAPIPWSEHQGV